MGRERDLGLIGRRLSRRLLVCVVSVWGVSTIVFVVTRLTGDPVLPVIQAISLVYSISFIGILLVVDALYRLIDPRSEPA